jgi:hypothetical protein
MEGEKKVTDFHEGDRIEFKCHGVVSKVTPLSVHIRLADLNDIVDMPVPPSMLTIHSEKMTLELDVDGELVRAVERVLGDLFWHAGKIAAEEVAMAAIDAVYSFHKKYYARQAASLNNAGGRGD